MNMNQVLAWLKANVFIVVFVVMAIVALVALPLVAAGMNASLREDVEQRARKLNELRQIERTNIEIPTTDGGVRTETAVVNQRLLERLREHMDVAEQEAESILQQAAEHNRKGRGVLMNRMFPEPPRAERDVLPERYYRRVIDAYEQLLQDVRAGTPPDPDLLAEDLQRIEYQFRTQSLARDIDEELSRDEQSELRRRLTTARLTRYRERAENLLFYASPDVIERPRWDPGRQPTMDEMFEWQWKYWIQEDLLWALHGANAEYPSLIHGPVKRLLYLRIHDAQAAGTGGGAQGGGGGRGGGSPMGGGSAPPRGGGAGAPQQPAGGGTAPNPQANIPLDYSVSITGRKTNSLYDVRYVDMELIVDTDRIPEVIDALSRQNFISVLRSRVEPADSYRAARAGYFYGPDAVSRLTMRLETVWLRTWTKEFMPAETRRKLGLPVE